jgi:hypothetical protein
LGGIGFAIAFAFSRSFLEGVVTEPWNRPNVLMLNAGVLLLFFAIAGVRAIFVLPAALPANWVFRVTNIEKVRARIAANRKTLILLVAVPVWIACALVYFAIWPFLPALQHVIVLFLIAAILVELSPYQFHKIPFTCSYRPPETNRRMKLGLYCVLFLAFSNSVSGIEFWAMQSPARFAVLVSILFGVGVWARRRTRQSMRRAHSIQFEDAPAADLLCLNLESAPTVYIDAPESKEQEIDEEIECHIRMAIRDRVERGEPAGQARRAVLREFGNPQFMKERTREVWRWTTLEQIIHDLRLGTRILRRAPLFSLAAIALITVGIGGNTAIFSMIHAILTKPAPGVTAKHLVVFGLTENGRLEDPSNSFPNYLDYAAQSRTMQSLLAFGFDRITTTLPDGTYELRGELVTPNYFDTLGVHLVKGRAFTKSEVSGASGLVAVIAWHVWQNQFHGQENIVGRPVVLNGIPATVVGVTAEDFHGTQFAPNFEIGVPIVSYLRLTSPRVLAYRPESTVDHHPWQVSVRSIVIRRASRIRDDFKTSTAGLSRRRQIEAGSAGAIFRDGVRRMGKRAGTHFHANSDCGRIIDAAHCLCERSQPHARPLGCTPARNGSKTFSGRIASADSSHAALRSSGAVAPRFRRCISVYSLGLPRCGEIDSADRIRGAIASGPHS